MAKGNLFLGMARKSVGDTTFYRAYGQQISRSRNRNPRNPQTSKQIFQRAIAATVTKAYKAGKMIFDHSFEGQTVPNGCQRRFLSLNMRSLRERIASDMASDVNSGPYADSLVGPRAMTPVMGRYYVSEGSIMQRFFKFEMDQDQENLLLKIPATSSEEESVAEYCARLGLVPGDIYTFVYFGYNSLDPLVGYNHPTIFAFERLTVKAGVSQVTAESSANDELGNNIFDRMAYNCSQSSLAELFPGASVQLNTRKLVGDAVIMSVACIRSRDDSGVRSTEQMLWTGFDNGGELAWNNVVAAWRAGETLGDANELILEGGDF